MKAKKHIPVIIHVLFCAIILLLPLLMMMSRNGTVDYRHYNNYFIRTCIVILLFYINYLVLIDRLLFKKKFLSYILINAVLIAGLVFLQNLLTTLMLGPPPPPPLPPGMGNRGMPGPPREMRLLSDYVIAVLAIGMSVALKATMRWDKVSIHLETVRAAQLEADLRNLRSQLNPHFLFNTLNNIYSLIATDSRHAQESVHRLSTLLRYILYENDRKFVPVDKELEFTRNYIDLMRLRLGPNVRLDVSIEHNGCDNQVAPLMFITLIENAFKHGINNDEGSFIDIKISVEKDRGILCIVGNSLDESKSNIDPKNSGIGLSNLRKRLELLYPDRHVLDIKRGWGHFSVLLRIDFDNKEN